MGKKKAQATQEHASKSFGQLVSKAALAQLGPHIAEMINEMSSNIILKQASTLQMLFTRLIAIEEVLMDHKLTSQDELNIKVANLQDRYEGLTPADKVEVGDTVRVTFETKQKTDEMFGAPTKLKIQNAGSGQYLGVELEAHLLGQIVTETKEINFGPDGNLVARLTVDRVSRPNKLVAQPEPSNDDNQPQG